VEGLGTRASVGEEGEERVRGMVRHGRHGHVLATLWLLLGFLCRQEREGTRGQGRVEWGSRVRPNTVLNSVWNLFLFAKFKILPNLV
jgi:hypothetical protein